MPRYRVDWCAGPNAQIELYRAGGDAGLAFKYTPPFRATLRPPVDLIPITADDLKHASISLRSLTAELLRGARDLAAGPAPEIDPTDDMQALGGLLFDLVMANPARHDLRLPDCFVDFGVEESMLHFPWELMHDGEDYLCLKHAFGRFVTGVAASPGLANPMTWLGSDLARVSVLLISVPQPRPRDGATLDHLPSAERETATIVEALSRIDGVELTVLQHDKATVHTVAAALRTGKYQIVHYCGHATYDAATTTNSALALWDGNLTAGMVQRLFVRAQPVLCVINACETARIPDERALNVYSLAKAFLDTGAYLVGSRWRLDDRAAASFAGDFYDSLLRRGEPLGNAMRAGRQAARQAPGADPFAWSAYVLYGDPRLCFRVV